MKYLIFLAILLFSQVVYAQQHNNDLIVTTTGDSIFCKIIDVNSSEIQFSFDHRGRIITIKREQTVSHTYNYKLATVQNQSATTEQNQSAVVEQSRSTAPPKRTTAPLYRFNIALSSGLNSFGTISIGEKISGGAFVAGADVVYFFNSYLGGGLKLNVASCDLNPHCRVFPLPSKIFSSNINAFSV